MAIVILPSLSASGRRATGCRTGRISVRGAIMTVMARLNRAVGAVRGVHLFMQPVQDVNIGGRLTAADLQEVEADLLELVAMERP